MKLDYASPEQVEAAVRKLRRWLTIWQCWAGGASVLLVGFVWLVDGYSPLFWRRVALHFFGYDPG